MAEFVETTRQVHWAPAWIPVTTTRTFRREVTSGSVHVDTYVDRPIVYQGPVTRHASVAVIPPEQTPVPARSNTLTAQPTDFIEGLQSEQNELRSVEVTLRSFLESESLAERSLEL